MNKSVVAAAILVCSAPAGADQHWGILVDTGAKKQSASIEVAAASPTGVRFLVWANGSATASNIAVAGETTLFASSASSSIPNLFAPSGGGTALVQAFPCDANGNLIAIVTKAGLRQDSGAAAKFSTELVGESRSLGADFVVPIGALESGTDLYVAAIGSDTLVQTRDGNNPFGAPVAIAANTVLRIPITAPNARFEVITTELLNNPFGLPTQFLVVLKVVSFGGKLAQTYIAPY